MTGQLHSGQPVETSGAALDGAGSALILLHGRGASAAEILGLGLELAGIESALLAPQAANHTWYPYSFLAPISENEPWLGSALSTVDETLRLAERAGVPAARTVLVGFSQGACLAAEFVARRAPELGALIAFTGGRIGPEGTVFNEAGDLHGMPVYLSAGDPDPHVPWRRMEETRDCLMEMGARVTLRRWSGRPHGILPQEIEEARQVIHDVRSGAP